MRRSVWRIHERMIGLFFFGSAIQQAVFFSVVEYVPILVMMMLV